MPDVETEDSDDLYRLPPQEFTAARDALAKRLRAAKNREKADEVKRLRRPSALAWALNQVARSDGDLIESVLAAGEELRDALGRGDGRAMRDAERAMRQASDDVVDAAGRVLGDDGNTVTDDARSRLASTLRAALVDADVAGRLRSGTLEKDVEVAGLGLEDMNIVAPARAARSTSRPSAPKDKQEKQEKKDKKDPEAERAGREERRRQEEARRAARVKVADLESTAERLAARAERLAGVAERAEEAARQARIEAGEAKAEAEVAAEQAASARAQFEQL